MRTYLYRGREWFERVANTAHARLWLAILSFTESSIFIIPPDPLLAAMVFVRQHEWVRYVAITSIASLAGAVFGYALGALLFEAVGIKIIDLYGLHVYMEQATTLLQNSVFIFTITAAFTPIPFKIAVLAAGFTEANFLAFFVAAFIGRTARYVLIGYVAKVFGDNFDRIMQRFWWWATIGGVVILVAYLVLIML